MYQVAPGSVSAHGRGEEVWDDGTVRALRPTRDPGIRHDLPYGPLPFDSCRRESETPSSRSPGQDINPPPGSSDGAPNHPGGWGTSPATDGCPHPVRSPDRCMHPRTWTAQGIPRTSSRNGDRPWGICRRPRQFPPYSENVAPPIRIPSGWRSLMRQSMRKK